MNNKIDSYIHPNDEMMAFIRSTGRSDSSYFRTGSRFAKKFPEAINRWKPHLCKGSHFLDFGCGHGRVTRYWPSLLSPAQFVVADVWDEAVRFCATRYAAIPVVVLNSSSIAETKLRFDLIICCSVFSHLPPNKFVNYLSGLADSMNSAGLMLFTVHGESVAHHYRLSLSNEYSFGSIGKLPNHTKGRLSGDEYSFMVVSQKYVNSALRQAKLKCLEVVEAAVGNQDLYVVEKL